MVDLLVAVATTAGCLLCLHLRLKVVEAMMVDPQGVVATPVLHPQEVEEVEVHKWAAMDVLPVPDLPLQQSL